MDLGDRPDWYVPADYRRVEEGHAIQVHKNDIVIVIKRNRPDYCKVYETKPALEPYEERGEERREIQVLFTI
jgi:hypothetical protein